MSTRYRWITAQGAPCSPLHRTVKTAARWAARAPRAPRETPMPTRLLAEKPASAQHGARRRALLAGEREQLLAELAKTRGVPLSAIAWVDRIRRSTVARRRRRMSLSRLTGAMHHDTRRSAA